MGLVQIDREKWTKAKLQEALGAAEVEMGRSYGIVRQRGSGEVYRQILGATGLDMPQYNVGCASSFPSCTVIRDTALASGPIVCCWHVRPTYRCCTLLCCAVWQYPVLSPGLPPLSQPLVLTRASSAATRVGCVSALYAFTLRVATALYCIGRYVCVSTTSSRSS